jgi:PST family polysaccharide transporter
MNNKTKSQIFQRIKNNLTERKTLQKIIGNTGWLLSDKILRLILDFGVNICLVRYLGPEKYGLLSYAIAFIALFEPIANLGLDQIVIRDILRESKFKQEIISTVFGLKLIASLMSFCAVIISIFYLKSGENNLHYLVIIIATSLFFKAFDVFEFWFHAQIKAKYIIITKNMSLALVNSCKIILILTKADLIYFGYLILIEVILSKLLILFVYLKKGEIFKLNLFSYSRAKSILRDSLLLMLSGLAILVYMRIDQIMLGQMTNDQTVGIYSVAVKLSESWLFLPMAISNSMLPVIVNYRQNQPERAMQKLQELFIIVVAIAYLIIIPCTFFAESIITILFGKIYQEAGFILSLHIWSGLFVSLGIARNIYLVTENFLGISFIFTLTGALVNVILNLILIPKYEAVGAAIATLISYLLASYLMGFMFKNTQQITWSLTKALIFQKK